LHTPSSKSRYGGTSPAVGPTDSSILPPARGATHTVAMGLACRGGSGHDAHGGGASVRPVVLLLPALRGDAVRAAAARVLHGARVGGRAAAQPRVHTPACAARGTGEARDWWKRPLPLVSPHDHMILIESGPGGLTREVETPLPSNSSHDHMILRVDLVGSHAGGGNALAFNQPT
jgi:hypothetical protein